MIEHATSKLDRDSTTLRKSTQALGRVQNWLESGGAPPDRNAVGTEIWPETPSDAVSQPAIFSHYYATLQLLYMVGDYVAKKGRGKDSLDQLIRRLAWVASDCREAVSYASKGKDDDSDWQLHCLRSLINKDKRIKFGERLRPSTLAK